MVKVVGSTLSQWDLASDEPGEGTSYVPSAKRASEKSEDSAARRKKRADPGQQSKLVLPNPHTFHR